MGAPASLYNLTKGAPDPCNACNTAIPDVHVGEHRSLRSTQ